MVLDVHRNGLRTIRRRATSRARMMLAICALLPIAGCMVGPNFKPPAAQTNEKFRESGQASFTGAPQDKPEWWGIFKDRTLNALILQAFEQNLSLQAASLRIVEARVGKTISNELLFPLITAQGSISHINLSETMTPDVEIDISQRLQDFADRDPLLGGGRRNRDPLVDVSVRPKLDVYDSHFDAIWELDLWGGKRRMIESSTAKLAAAYANYDDVMVSLAGEVAADYIKLRTGQQRLKVMRENVEVMKNFKAIAEQRFANKESPETDVYLARTLLSIIAVGIPKVENALQQTENALCMLLGKTPQDLRATLGEAGPIPAVQADIAVGVPADLLRRRPDVRMAEHLAHAQCARIGMAKADILPSFSLFGSLGLKTTESEMFFESESVTGAYGGLVKATGLVLYPFTVERVRLQDARFEESVLNYQMAVLNASREVEDAMIAFLKALDEKAILADGSEAATRSAELAVAAYQQGKVIVSVPLVALTFQANLQDQVLASEGAAATNVAALYKALGGGWENRREQELVPEEIRNRMKDRTDWRSFSGSHDLKTGSREPINP